MMAFCFLAFLRIGSVAAEQAVLPVTSWYPFSFPALHYFLFLMWPLTASPPAACFYCVFFQTLLHQNMVAALSQQGKQQGTESASECQRDDGSGCAVQLGPHKQAGEGEQQQGQGGDIAKQLPAEAGTHAAVQPV